MPHNDGTHNVTTLATDIPSAPSEEGRHPGSMRERSTHNSNMYSTTHISHVVSLKIETNIFPLSGRLTRPTA